MRMFWAFIAGLTLLTAALWIVPTSASSPDAMAYNGASPGDIATPPQAGRSGRENGTDGSSLAVPRDDEPARADSAAADAASAGVDGDDDVVPLDPEAEALLNDLMDDYEARRDTESTDADTDATRTVEGSEDDAGDAPAGSNTGGGDGSDAAGERFIVTGSGTADDPYEITWDLLISAAETYSPRMGMTDMPERVERLDGAHVKITGYLAFPLPGQMNDEVLVMLNEWDGCCLGVPPSPYDAIEVRLAQAVQSQQGQHLVSYGTVTGILEVDPYVVEDWLLGLYLMDGASLTVDM